MKFAVVALTRGYPKDKSLYKSLIKRNNSIYEHINKLRKAPVDVLLFHEGNISLSDQGYISKHSMGELKFVNVSKYFMNSTLEFDENEKFNLGYRQMCKFNMFHIWDELYEYDYILRVDEDIMISEFDPFIFEYMKSNSINYMTGRFTKEIHRTTNRTLPQFLMENTDLDVKKIYNHKFPYTNLYATKVEFWRNKDVNNLLRIIALSNEQIINRWGDIPVQGLVLNYKNEKIKLFPKLEYKHISHNFKIKNNFLRNLTVNAKFNPISIKEGLYTKLKVKFKGQFKSANPFEFDKN